MKKVVLLCLFCATSWAVAAPRHMVVASPSGIGISGSYQKISPESDSLFDQFNILKSNVSLNYHYTLTPQIQLGGFFSNISVVRDYKTQAGQEGEVSYQTLFWGLDALWNFSEDLMNSYYTGILLAYNNHEEEFSKNVFNFLEDDRTDIIYEFILGKRWSLQKWGLENITYSPSLSLFISDSGKDYSDDGLERSFGLTLQVVKFDVLF